MVHPDVEILGAPDAHAAPAQREFRARGRRSQHHQPSRRNFLLMRRRGGGRHLLVLQGDHIVADRHLVARLERGGVGDTLPVDSHAVVGREVLEGVRAVHPLEPRVPSRDVALRQTDGVPLLPSDRDLVTYQRNDRGLPFVVRDDELEHRDSGFLRASITRDARSLRWYLRAFPCQSC